MKASSVVTVLPMTIAPASRKWPDNGGIGLRPAPCIEHGAVFRGHIRGVDDVFDANGHARQRKRRQIGARIESRGLSPRLLRLEILPRLNLRAR